MNLNHMKTWGSHVPVNKSIMEFFDITGVMEIGAGYNSTPVFFKNAPYVVSIETDKEWVEKMKADIQEDENHKMVYHEIASHITRPTRRHAVSQDFLDQSYEFWMSHLDDRMNFLFVDCISSLRLEAITRLYEHFDVITFHDYQNPGIVNHYSGGVTPPKGFNGYIDKTYRAHTGVWINKDIDFDLEAFRKVLDKNAKEYINDSGSNLQPWS